MKPTDEYKICSLEEAEEFAKKRMENPYELADELLAGGEWSMRAQAMIRYQADRIAELSKNVDELEEELLKAPQIKELSDEEIMNLYKETKADNGGIREFARAILRKAQEK